MSSSAVLCLVLFVASKVQIACSMTGMARARLTNNLRRSSVSRNIALYSSRVDVPSRNSVAIGDISAQMRDMRAAISADERTKLMMDALRGKNMNDDDKQGLGIDMKLVSTRTSNANEEELPMSYDPVKLEKYFRARPRAVATRIFQILSASTKTINNILFDLVTGNSQNIEVQRAAELRNTIVSLGPFFIKLGQALSIRPDILSPRAMVELQQLCDKVPCFDSALAMQTIERELGRPVGEVFECITAEPVAAASLGQVYRATLRATGEEVAVKVQRPFVLETVSLDLYLVRQMGLLLRHIPSLTARFDLAAIVDEFAGNFYRELDYIQECNNGIQIAKDMAAFPMVLIPRSYPEYTTRRVLVAQWIEGEKLSQSKAGDVRDLVNLGVITYLTQLLDTGFFHADPHPGNMLRSPDGRLVILDFGLMTRITENQKYGMVEAIAHLIHRDYEQIGQDFKNLDFIPEGVDTGPIIPALSRVFDAALAGGGAKSINFQELAADLAEITFTFPFRIPPYFALIIRAISVLEGIALVGDPDFAIVDEAYPFIARLLLTDKSPRLRAAFRYMVYGKSDVLDADRLIDLLQALEQFISVKAQGQAQGQGQGSSGTATTTVDSNHMSTGRAAITKLIPVEFTASSKVNTQTHTSNTNNDKQQLVRESLLFFFSDEGSLLRDLVLDEISSGIDALSREAVYALLTRLAPLGVRYSGLPRLLQVLAPPLSAKDTRQVESLVKLVTFLTKADNSSLTGVDSGGGGIDIFSVLSPRKVVDAVFTTLRSPASVRNVLSFGAQLQDLSPNMRDFVLRIAQKLVNTANKRIFDAVLSV